jgi:uncharacterized protein
MSLQTEAIVYAAKETNLPANVVMSVCRLIVEEECTVPFIARYRKEATSGMDEVQIRSIHEHYEMYLEIEKRRAFIVEAVTKMEMMTPELLKQIQKALNLNQLEDLYAPFKSKKKTKAMIAKELGLEPLAHLLLTSKTLLTNQHIEESFVKPTEGKVKDILEALNGASDILSDRFAHDIDVKEKIRRTFWDIGYIQSLLRPKGNEVSDWQKFKDFFEFKEPLSKIKEAKNSHRYQALRRGMNLKILKVDVQIPAEVGYEMIESHFFPASLKPAHQEFLKKCALKAYDQMILPSLDLEIKNDLKKMADTSAINVFGINLKNLLLQPYLGSKAVLGIDPGIRTGCKVVIIDSTGKFLGDHVIYPFAPKNDISGSALILSKMIEAFKIEYVCIGNGTFGRETLEFVETHVSQVKEGKVKATIISESGASIYSASDIAREEFPDKDVTVRGAISIARRFQDPLAELVKLDPKSIGVGQYQHDVNQVQLKNSLEAIVESCVNFVGVDLNTASAPLLSYVSGIGPTVAQNVVKFREENKGFKNRTELLKVSRFSQKIFEQSAGFLRIYQGDQPLDSTFIHPERYETLSKWVATKKRSLQDLLTDVNLQTELLQDKTLIKDIGEMTLQDIIKCLRAPSQDPRTIFKSVEFAKGIHELKDLKMGTWYNGVVTNITMFGAFVDIGIKENGLLHVSEISHEFVDNALEKLKVGMELKVKVISLDMERKRIALSCKPDTRAEKSTPSAHYQQGNAKKPIQNSNQPQFKNNAFSGLKNIKLN